GGNRWLIPLIILAGLLFLGAVAGFILLPRLNIDLPPAVAGLLGRDDPPRPATPQPADTLAPTNEIVTDDPPTKEAPHTDESPVTADPPTEVPPVADPPTATVTIPAAPPTPTATTSPSPTPT